MYCVLEASLLLPRHANFYVLIIVIIIITRHTGQLSLAVPSWVGTMSTDQRAVIPCGWEVKAGMVYTWLAGKNVGSLRYNTDHI